MLWGQQIARGHAGTAGLAGPAHRTAAASQQGRVDSSG